MTELDTIDLASRPAVTNFVLLKTFGILAILFIAATALLPRKKF